MFLRSRHHWHTPEPSTFVAAAAIAEGAETTEEDGASRREAELAKKLRLQKEENSLLEELLNAQRMGADEAR